MTFVFVYRDGYKDSGYKKILANIDALAKDPSVALIKVNVGPDGSPFLKAYPGAGVGQPELYCYSRGRKIMAAYRGHSMMDSVTSPDRFIKEQIAHSNQFSGGR